MDNNYKKVLTTTAKYCSVAERCEADVLRRLSKYQLSTKEEETLINQLKEENFLNEERYAKAFVNDKYKFSKWGKRKISQALYEKGISSQCISSALEFIDDSVYIQNLKELLESKNKTIKAKDSYEHNGKLIRFALGRGYQYNEIAQIIANIEDFYTE